MAELLINEFFSTYPFHMFAYLPFHTNLRYPGKITILLSALADQLIKSRHSKVLLSEKLRAGGSIYFLQDIGKISRKNHIYPFRSVTTAAPTAMPAALPSCAIVKSRSTGTDAQAFSTRPVTAGSASQARKTFRALPSRSARSDCFTPTTFWAVLSSSNTLDPDQAGTGRKAR